MKYIIFKNFSSVALCKLLQYGINTDDKRLQDIRVKGEEIFNMEEGIRTRSKAAKSEYLYLNQQDVSLKVILILCYLY